MAGLELNRETLLEILKALHYAFLVIDAEGRVVFLNQAAERLLGVKAKECTGTFLGNVFPCARLLDVLERGEGFVNEKIEINGNRNILCSSTVLKKEDRVAGAFCLFQDYNELEKKLQLVEAAYEELNTILDSSFDGIWISDGNGVTLRVNKNYEKFSGIKAEEVLGRSLQDLVREGYYSDSAALHVLQKGEPVTLIHEIKTGKKAMVTASPVFDKDGKIYRVITNVRDITLLSELQEKLEQMKHLQKKYECEIQELRRKKFDKDIVCNSRSMEIALEQALRVAGVDTTVLLLGESGVGKGLVAKFIHKNSKRKDNPFIKINCAAIPENLLESELFGYEKGSFTGASKEGKPGLFELAHKGTVFLDEIAKLPLHLQVKLLQAVQERNFYRVGGTRLIELDVRIIAATNKNLTEMIQKGTFREDLYYRLNVVTITIPPLRERREDIPLLISYFLDKFNGKHGYKKRLSSDVVDLLVDYRWPGNVRELENVIERLVVLSEEEVISVADLPAAIRSWQQNGEEESYTIRIPKNASLKKALEVVEKFLLQETLFKGGSTRSAARLLAVDQSTVVRKAQKYKIRYDRVSGLV